MNSPLHTVSALLVSASEAQTKRIGALLTRARIDARACEQGTDALGLRLRGGDEQGAHGVQRRIHTSHLAVEVGTEKQKDASDADKGHFPPGHRETSAFSKRYHMYFHDRISGTQNFSNQKSMYIIHHGFCTCQE